MGDTPSKSKSCDRDRKAELITARVLKSPNKDSCSRSYLQQQAVELKKKARLTMMHPYRAEVLCGDEEFSISEPMQQGGKGSGANIKIFVSSFDCPENCTNVCCRKDGTSWANDDLNYQQVAEDERRSVRSRSLSLDSYSFLYASEKDITGEVNYDETEELPIPDVTRLSERSVLSHRSKSSDNLRDQSRSQINVDDGSLRPTSRGSEVDAERTDVLPAGMEGNGTDSSNGVSSDDYFTPDSQETESDSDLLEVEHRKLTTRSKTMVQLDFLPPEFRLEVFEKICNRTAIGDVVQIVEDGYFCAKELCPRPVRYVWTMTERILQWYGQGIATTSWPVLWLVHRFDRCAAKALDSYLNHALQSV